MESECTHGIQTKNQMLGYMVSFLGNHFYVYVLQHKAFVYFSVIAKREQSLMYDLMCCSHTELLLIQYVLAVGRKYEVSLWCFKPACVRVCQEDAAASEDAEGPSRGGTGLLQFRQHLHTSPRL